MNILIIIILIIISWNEIYEEKNLGESEGKERNSAFVNEGESTNFNIDCEWDRNICNVILIFFCKIILFYEDYLINI